MSAAPDSKLSRNILIGLTVGLGLGLLSNFLFAAGGPFAAQSAQLDATVTHVIQPVGRIFLRLIFMVVIPLIFSAVVIGALELGTAQNLGRVGLKTFLVTFILSSLSVLIALVLVNLVQPGRVLPPEARESLLAQYGADSGKLVESGTKDRPISQTLLNLLPENPLMEAVNAFNPAHTGGGMLAVMIFSLIVGLAMASADQAKIAGLRAWVEGLFEICMVIIGFALRLAPLGVACLGFTLGAKLGLDVFQTVGIYVITVIAGLAIHQFISYPAVLLAVGKSPVAFFREIKEAMVTAFATSSSNATLPVSLRVAEENLGLPRRISRFVLTVGASANQNGTALYEGITVLFLAQVFGVELSFSQQITVALMCILAGIGTAGVPGGSLPLVAGVLATVGVQPDAIAIILGVDRLLDMCRTVLNVTGDMVVAVVVSKNEVATDAGVNQN